MNPIREMYLDWFNNFLTVARFAEHYQITEELASKIIDEGRELHKLETEGVTID